MNIRCPSCATLFRASEEVIEQGQGYVRCSRCRNVFKAIDNIETTAAESMTDASFEEAPAPSYDQVAPEFPQAESAGAEELDNPKAGQPPATADAIATNLPDWLRAEIAMHLDPGTARGRTARIALAILFSGILLATLAGQLAYLRIENSSQITFLRPGLAQLCEWLSCKLPPKRDLDSLRLVESQITRRESGAIDLTISISNLAKFPQAYPAIHLSMSNYLNQPVAAGRFLPRNYVGADKEIDAGATVVVELAIEDPGMRIRAYDINFL